MTRDHKFGYHWIWLTPILYVVLAAHSTLSLLSRIKSRITSRVNDWRYPHLKNARMLAGIVKKEER